MIKPRILIVEDNLLIAKDISIILEQEGYETSFGITTVDEAISALSTTKFNLVFIDVNLRNHSDGVTLGNYLLELDTIPYIYITSYADNVTLERIKYSRPHGMIVKPFKALDIKSTVSLVLNNYKHKKIDVVRSDTFSIDEVPFILKDVVHYIDTHVDSRIDLHELSDRTPWSNQHFIRVFSKYIGETPYQYILKKKMEKAKVLITETDLSMKDIAFDLGFLSYGNFCKLFKREMGMNPELYRKLQKVNQYLSK